MRLLFIRHANPDYENDSLTETGKKEAIALGEFLASTKIDEIYVSPLGRAKQTLDYYLKISKTEVSPIIKDWLREFDAYCPHDNKHNAWDFLPSTLETYGNKAFSNDPQEFINAIKAYKDGDFLEKYNKAISGLDEILKNNGYSRNGLNYDVIRESEKTIAFFCHFGISSMLLSHLINCSPLTIGQYFCAAPSSVTTIYSEERRKGVAQFRISSFGDTSHLALKGMKPSFSARFSETFSDPRRHD